MSSQTHTGIEKVDNEASTILERKKCEGIFHYYYYYYYYLIGEPGGGDDRAPVITAAFIVCQIGKFITLYINTMRSADRPRKARSDLPKEGVIEN